MTSNIAFVLLVLSSLAATAIAVSLFLVRRRLERDLAKTRATLEAAGREVAVLQHKVSVLTPYTHIVNTEAHIQSLMQAAQQRVQQVELHITRVNGEAEERARATVRTAQQTATEIEQAARRSSAQAREQAEAIVEQAKREAQQTAGEALEAMRKAKDLEKTAKALQNVIDGYGDRYIVPTQSLIDEMASQYEFTDAGQKLKATREGVRSLVKSKRAATCDYVEENRRETAISFVTDAFNGKVDTVLADVRHDNYGTLEQKIKDAFVLVNHNGQAFREARITSEYLQARLTELRWAVVVQELKLRDREEQRLLKERIREEERAQREFEKAMRDAEKEEDMLRKAMEKAQGQLAKATEEQKAKYEAQLAELNARLREAEEKNQRALSMAQQTKAGHVYVISNVGSFGENVFKIGLTRRLEPLDRIRELGDASVPFEFDVHALIRADDAPALERELHRTFVRTQMNKVNPRKEFFRVDVRAIREEVERLGCLASWTMAAEAREYKETVAIERAMDAKTIEESKWVEQQLEEHRQVMTVDGEAEVLV